jgi:prephenate dehydrogenase
MVSSAEDIRGKKIAVIGLGLIGGSLAKALRFRAGITNVIAYCDDTDSISSALKDGTIREGYSGLNGSLADCDAVFICTPVNLIIKYIDEVSKVAGSRCIITDVCSTKSDILRHVNGMPSPPLFIGGHPMTGSEKSGYPASVGHLFENAWYILTPSRASTAEALSFMTALIKGIGALPLIAGADEHDAITAGISHVPHILAASLVNSVRKADSPEGKMQLLAAGGFRDITRIASSSPVLWESIISSNREKVSQFLDIVIENLSEIRKAVASGDSSRILAFFQEAREYRDAMPVSKKGLITPLYDISVDVVDKPGIIGRLATLLGEESINIKNIHVSNNREFENGCLKISFGDAKNMKNASQLLAKNGYRVTVDQYP